MRIYMYMTVECKAHANYFYTFPLLFNIKIEIIQTATFF